MMPDYGAFITALKTIGYNDGTRDNRAHHLARLFNVNDAIDSAAFSSDVRLALRPFIDSGVLLERDGRVESTVRVVPFRGYYFVVDSPKLYRHQHDRYSYVGGDGLYLCDFVVERLTTHDVSTQRCLDLCAGSAVMGIALSPHFKNIICTDIHPPAVEWARVNQSINDCDNVEVVQGSLYDGLEGPFSVIIANPSYSIFPDEFAKTENLLEYEMGGGKYGLELTMDIIAGFDDYLTPKGDGFICTNDPIVRGRDLLAELLEETYAAKDYAFEIHYVTRCRTKDRSLQRFHKDLGIDRIYFVILVVKKDQPFSIQYFHLPLWTELEQWARFKFSDHWAYRQARRLLKRSA